MTKCSQKKTTMPSSLAAKATDKKGQNTLQTAWDKKAVMTDQHSAQMAIPLPDTLTVPMTENTPSVMDAMDTKMGVPPEPWPPLSPDKWESSLSKCLKAASSDSPTGPTHTAPLPQLTDTHNATPSDLFTPASKTDLSAQQITPQTAKSTPPPHSSTPASPTTSKPRGWPPPSPNKVPDKAFTPSSRAATPP